MEPVPGRRPRLSRIRLIVFLASLTAPGLNCAWAGAEAESARLPELVLLSPGGQVVDAPPRGWSHLVLKSVPKLESGDLSTLPRMAMSTATLIRTVIAADIRPSDHGASRAYRLRRIGLGLCVPVEGVDTIIDVAHGSSPPFSLGLVERQVLGRAEEELRKARLVARTETCAVLAAPSELSTSEGHQHVYLVYVLLVEPARGDLRTLVWSIPAQSTRRSAPASLTELNPGTIYRCGLDVSADRLLGKIPVNWSFAMRSLPPGERIAFPAELKSWTLDLKKISSNPRAFERDVRDALQGRP